MAEVFGTTEKIKDIHSIVLLAPHLNKADIERFIENIEIDKNNIHELVFLAPYLNKNTVDKLIERTVETSAQQLGSVLPDFFLDEWNGPGTALTQLQALAPFLSKGMIRKLMKSYSENHNVKGISSLSQFI